MVHLYPSLLPLEPSPKTCPSPLDVPDEEQLQQGHVSFQELEVGEVNDLHAPVDEEGPVLKARLGLGRLRLHFHSHDHVLHSFLPFPSRFRVPYVMNQVRNPALFLSVVGTADIVNKLHLQVEVDLALELLRLLNSDSGGMDLRQLLVVGGVYRSYLSDVV